MSASETFPAEVVRELRALPVAASPDLRERVRALGEPAPRRVRLSVPPLRRTLLVLAPVCVAVLLAAAVVRGLVSSGSAEHPSAFVKTTPGASRKASSGHAVSGSFN